MMEEAELGAWIMSNCLPVCNESCTNYGGSDSKHGYDATINLQFLYYHSEKKSRWLTHKNPNNSTAVYSTELVI